MNELVSRALSRVEITAPGCRTGMRERLLSRFFGRIRVGHLTVTFPSGDRQAFLGAEPGPHAAMHIHSLRLLSRLLVSGDIGIAEAYIAGEWDTPDLSSLLMLGNMNAEALSDALGGSWAASALNRLRHAFRANTRAGSRRNIRAHYDLGNDFYARWLDRTMTYSSALFGSGDETLEDAQREKYRCMARALDLGRGDRVLEIGCGWGGFAEYAAAELGCEVVGLTLSVAQADYARDRMRRAGLADKVEIRLQDYRDVDGEFDKIVSIEMLEAVGEANWGTYFEVLNRRLKPGGRAAVQVITIADHAFEAYRRNPDFIQRYIFPGGMLPSPAALARAVSRSGLRIAGAMRFGDSYAETLRRWDAAFQDRWPEIETLGFDRRFYRMWRYYLGYCEVGFDCGHIDVGQYVIARP